MRLNHRTSGAPQGVAPHLGYGPPGPGAPHLLFWAAPGPGGQGMYEKKLERGAFLKFSFFSGILIKMAESLLKNN